MERKQGEGGVAARALEIPVPYGYWELLCIPALLLCHRLCYNLIGALHVEGSTDYAALLLTGMDTQIPYVPAFVLPYVFTWGYAGIIAIYALYFRTYDHLIFRYFYFSFLLMTGVECLLWFSFPARISIRTGPEVLALHGWLGELTAVVYAHATPWNVFPSAHVAFAYASWILSAYFAKREHRWLFLVLFVLIALSVLFIKNHFLWDIVGSVLVVQLIYRVFFLPAYRRRLLHDMSGVAVGAVCLVAATLAAVASYTIVP